MDLEGSRRGPVVERYRYLAKLSEEEHESPQPVSLVSLHKFQSATSQTKVRHATAKLCFSARAFCFYGNRTSAVSVSVHAASNPYHFNTFQL